METTKQPDAPNCYKCDDMGYMPGDEVFGVSRCSCPIGVTVDMRAQPGAIVFGNGSVKIDGNGITWSDEVLKEAGRARRATLEGQSYEQIKAKLDRAERALLRAGFQDLGGEEWKPPLGPAPHFITVREESLSDVELTQADLIKHANLIVEAITPRNAMDGAMAAYKDLLIKGQGAYIQNDDGTTEHVPVAYIAQEPLKTMAYPDRRTEAAKVKVIWPDPSKMNFTPDRRDPYSTLTQEQHDRRSYDRNKK